MATVTKKPVFHTVSNRTLEIAPETEFPVSVDEMIKRRDAWREKYQHLLEGYSVAEFLREKRHDVKAGLE